MISESLAPFVHRVVVALPGDSVRAAARKMGRERVGCVLVVRDGRLVGILTDRDVVLRAVAGGLDPEHTTVEEIMTADPLSLQDGDTIDAAVRSMREHGVRRLPIVDGERRAIGIVTADDVVTQLAAGIAAVGEAIAEPADSDESR